MRFYMPAKPSKQGFKFHALVDNRNNYLYNLIFDPGNNYKNLISPNSGENYAYQIVLSLLDGLEGKVYTLYYDSWHSSIMLTNKLTELGFNIITTLRKNAKFFQIFKKQKIVQKIIAIIIIIIV